MIEARRLTEHGLELFKAWLDNPQGSNPPTELLNGADHTEVLNDIDLDPGMTFSTRYGFGLYLNERLATLQFKDLLNPQNDGLWAWLAVLYFGQLSSKKIRRREHYVVTHKGARGSLAYRQAARSCYELVHIHGEKSLVCLGVAMHTFGDLAEQLTSRQKVAHNRGFFRAAFDLYVRGGTVQRKANAYPRKKWNRKPGDQTGLGGARRLEIAFRRLALTFDTEVMDSTAVISVLPKEFRKWKSKTTA